MYRGVVVVLAAHPCMLLRSGRYSPTQNKYSLGASDSVPLTLQSDLVRMTKLAKLGHSDLATSVAQCCGTGSFSGNYNSDGTSSNNGDAGSAGNSNGNPGIGSAAFTNYTTALENKISQTTVNISAIVSALPPGIDDGSSALPIPASLAGRLLNSGGITNCKVGPAVAGFLACSC